jgi:hypothetical protein
LLARQRERQTRLRASCEMLSWGIRGWIRVWYQDFIEWAKWHKFGLSICVLPFASASGEARRSAKERVEITRC